MGCSMAAINKIHTWLITLDLETFIIMECLHNLLYFEFF